MCEYSKKIKCALDDLGLTKIPTQTELRRVRRELMFALHPDRCPNSAADLARVNAAFETLLDKCVEDAGEQSSRPARPNRGVRLAPLEERAASECRELLRDAADPTENMSENHDHIPQTVRRRGRQLSYIIGTPLAQGVNRVAVPTGEFVDKRKILPKLLKFASRGDGSGTFEIPAETRSSLFPGARSVKIHFATT